MKKLKLPKWATIAVSVLAGAVELLNVTTFGLPSAWQALVTVVDVGLFSSLGIAPLTGPALQNVLHISHVAALSLASAFATGSVAISQISGLDTTTRGIISGVVALAAGVLFGPAPSLTPTPPPTPAVTPPAKQGG